MSRPKKPNGRPPAIPKTSSKQELLADFTVQKLIEAFKMDCSVEEACAYADISKQTFYTHCELNPTFLDIIERSRQTVITMARSVIVNAIGSGDENTAKWYLERKRRSEFATRQEQTGADGSAIQNKIEITIQKKYDNET